MLTVAAKIAQFIRYPAFLFIVFGVILLVPALTQADELSRAALLSYTCAGCHGTGGKSPGSIPSIPCTSSTELVKTLESFRDGKRFSTVMGRHIKGYSKEEVRLIAGYFTTYCDADNTKK
jgi:sulfide dehydrogenase cytochrome subunit